MFCRAVPFPVSYSVKTTPLMQSFQSTILSSFFFKINSPRWPASDSCFSFGDHTLGAAFQILQFYQLNRTTCPIELFFQVIRGVFCDHPNVQDGLESLLVRHISDWMKQHQVGCKTTIYICVYIYMHGDDVSVVFVENLLSSKDVEWLIVCGSVVSKDK